MNQYSQFNRKNVLVKMNRRNNPVNSVSQMAREFGLPRTSVTRELRLLLSSSEYLRLKGHPNTPKAYA